ncbi:hypothetical protein H2200_009065 [Cladophialophora chaetospira]|uniref:ABC transporter domain-containing protein n=1 Tax=Cladophialophora chaetospira TaxID=386627 RepID=A0AA38X3E3_9EURO|nr:hypothetical protein H2200_009065 [Cladophialophora chaetospira]
MSSSDSSSVLSHANSILENDTEIVLQKTQTRSSVKGVYQAAEQDDFRYPSATNTEVSRIASALPSISTQLSRNLELQRYDTAAGLQRQDPRLNPTDPSFDFHLWARFFTLALEKEGIRPSRSGFAFRNLNVSGTGAAVQLQKNVGSLLRIPFGFKARMTHRHSPEKRILKDFAGAVRQGEMLLVLGRPGSGCTTFLKTICGQLLGLKLAESSVIHYNGVPQDIYRKELRGEVLYNQETEKHFPHLTVAQTLQFAAAARTPSQRVFDLPRQEFSKLKAEVAMSLFGLSHVRNTKVGNDFIRGVSGGERKRVSIAEMGVSGAQIGAWDNSTRGLDAATALDFVRALRVSANTVGTTHAVALYQASQSIYDVFDKVIVLYEGKQIYFGPTAAAKQYFESMGWLCPSRQTTGDFLTSVTNPSERRARPGYEQQVPRTASEFESYWHGSAEYRACVQEIQEVEAEYPVGGPTLETLRKTHHLAQAAHTRSRSAYRISVPMQVKLCLTRAYQRMIGDRTSTISTVVAQIIQSLIIGSIFYGTPTDTNGFFAKGSVLFFAVLMNTLASVSEITTLFNQRPVVEKHKTYAFYHPFAEGLADVIAFLPVKFLTAVVFNIILYFLGDLRREPGPFFIYFLFAFTATLTMSAIFRTIAASSKAIPQAMSIAGVLLLAIVIYTGFTLQTSYMHPWLRWVGYINPVAYAYEALLMNEVHNRDFPCATQSLVPPYGQGEFFRCAVKGSQIGEREVSGDAWAAASYGYEYSHLWRNYGILAAFMLFFYVAFLVATEFNSDSTSTAEFLIFRRGHVPAQMQETKSDLENNKASAPEEDNTSMSAGGTKQMAALAEQKDIFSWRNLTLDVPVKGGQRRLLDGVSGWVKPGTLTALMGVSGAGKTTLLDTLAQRISVGVITGDMLVNGQLLEASFQRNTGYVQQQDLHLETATVREALRFSALLRQPKSVPIQEKYAFVEDVIRMLGMEDFSEAIVGVPGEGLNVEQRKLLTIGVELAAKPALLLFLDEPTSGLDSQSSYMIVSLLRKLADNGQAVLSTIHQPSAMLFQQFDRLLFLAKGGKTVYFGDIGANSRTLLNYFEKAGARTCSDDENPAEYMLEIIVVGSHNKSTNDWPAVWQSSSENQAVQLELDGFQATKAPITASKNAASTSAYAIPLGLQLRYVTYRGFQQYWRTPTYVLGKFGLCTMSALFVGFSFWDQNSSYTGMQNTIFSIFMTTTIFTPLVQQIMPRFVTQRALYEVRERPSKTYSWIAFIYSNIVVEIPYQIVAALLVFVAWYFSVFGTGHPAGNTLLMLGFTIQFYMYTSTFAYMVISALPDAQTGANVATLLFSMILTFNGVLQRPDALPGFWTFMWRVSPFTYMMGGWAGTGLDGRKVVCSENELAIFNPPANQTCQSYLTPYFEHGALGYLNNPSGTSNCQYCPFQTAEQYLELSSISPSQRFRNLGIGYGFILFNIVMAVWVYYLFRVRRVSFRGPAKFVQRVQGVFASKARTAAASEKGS